MKIAILPGDGIGPEIISQAVKVLKFFGLSESLSYSSIGGAGYDEFKKHCLLKGLDDIGLTLEYGDGIKDFEKHYYKQYPWLTK